MNKTVTINLSGIIFHIDEDAYQKLHEYLSAIKGYFSESEGRDEIMADIENRIAEMFLEKISDKKQVVLISDVEHVIEVMGKPEDFAGEKAQNKETKKEQPAHGGTGRRRRVFRDTDNKILGGVCSGIAAYFNIDPLWIRLALVVCFFTFGAGFLLYIVLWIVIPGAKTYAEKLEMHGEDVNISNIGKKIEEELHDFGRRMGQWGEEVKQTASSVKGKKFIDKFVDFLTSVFGAFFSAFAKLLGVFFIIIGLVFMAGIVSSLFGTSIIHVDNYSLSIREFFNTFFDDRWQIVLASLAIALCLGIPFLMLVYGGVKMLLGIKAKNKIVNFSAGILWAIGIVLAIVIGMQIQNQFSEESLNEQKITLPKTKCDTLFLRLKEVQGWNGRTNFSKRHFRFSFREHRLLFSDSANIYFGYPTVDIIRDESDSIEIMLYKESHGADKKEAAHFARNINYEILQRDSLVELMPYFSIPKDEKWRNQQVHIEIRLPKGKIIYLAKNTCNILTNIQNETYTWDKNMAGQRWLMGEEELRCVDCKPLGERKTKKWSRHRQSETDESK